jgi:hypothetical protein
MYRPSLGTTRDRRASASPSEFCVGVSHAYQPQDRTLLSLSLADGASGRSKCMSDQRNMSAAAEGSQVGMAEMAPPSSFLPLETAAPNLTGIASLRWLRCPGSDREKILG